MRYSMLAIALLALLTLACGGGGSAKPAPTSTSARATVRPTATPGPAAREVDVRDLLLRPEDVPPGLGQLSEPSLQTAEEFRRQALSPDQLQAVGTVMADDVAAWGVLGAATQSGSSSDQYPASGAQLITVGVVLCDGETGATTLLPVNTRGQDRAAVEEYEAFPGRDVLQYEELSEPSFGDESRLVRYVSGSKDDPVELETYYLVFRRNRVVAGLQVRAPEGNVTLEQPSALAKALDKRIQSTQRSFVRGFLANRNVKLDLERSRRLLTLMVLDESHRQRYIELSPLGKRKVEEACDDELFRLPTGASAIAQRPGKRGSIIDSIRGAARTVNRRLQFTGANHLAFPYWQSRVLLGKSKVELMFHREFIATTENFPEMASWNLRAFKEMNPDLVYVEDVIRELRLELAQMDEQLFRQMWARTKPQHGVGTRHRHTICRRLGNGRTIPLELAAVQIPGSEEWLVEVFPASYAVLFRDGGLEAASWL